MKILFFIPLLITFACNAQNNKLVGGPCEDCDAALDYTILNSKPKPSLTIEGFSTTEPKIRITGTVVKPDRKTPAGNIILYVYQTNREGIYEPSKNPIGWEKRHGKFRGWMKTDADGTFEFYTFRPASYPNGREPEHIHLYIKEPGKNPYYADNYVFDDDPMLSPEVRKSLAKRGGSGILKLKTKDNILTANRDIILGLNIPNYN